MALEKVGRYRIKGYLGRGGMSTVYLAHDPLTERDVAIKLLPHDLLRQPTFRERFEREAKMIAGLDHPAIVPVYDIGDEEGQPYIVMRHMPAESLEDRLARGAIPLAEIVHIVVRLALALDEVHAQGIVHRDLKPSNILFDQWDEPFLTDFGTAKLSEEYFGLTEPGATVGTPAYISPEQVRGDADLDGRSDIYALGVMLFEMLTGRHPFSTDTPIAVALKHVTAPVPQLNEFKPGVPAAFQVIVDRAMAKEREERYQSAASFAQELAGTLAAASSVAGRVNPRTTGKFTAPAAATESVFEPGLVRRLFSRLRLAWMGGAALLVLIVIIGDNWVQTANTVATPDNAALLPATTKARTATPSAAHGSTPTGDPARSTRAAETVTASPTSTPVPTDTFRPTSSPTQTSTPDIGHAAIAVASSVFASPSVEAAELAIVQPGDVVTVLGRSPIGLWLHVSTEDGTSGYVYGDRVEWAGAFEALPTVNAPIPIALDCADGACPMLTLDVYPLPGSRCTADTIYRSVYLRGQGGNRLYTYFWNGVQLSGPLEDSGITLEVDDSTGTFVTAMARVESGDGQVAEVEAYVSDFICE